MEPPGLWVRSNGVFTTGTAAIRPGSGVARRQFPAAQTGQGVALDGLLERQRRVCAEGTLRAVGVAEDGALAAPVWASGELAMYYAPFDYLNVDARIVVVGITPSWGETLAAWRVAREGLAQGLPWQRVLRLVKQEASFGGGTRRELVGMLDGIWVHAALGIGSTDLLFGPEAAGLVHATAVLRYPVLARGRNYTGWNPPLLQHAELRAFGEGLLAGELRQLSGALVVPLGALVGRVLEGWIAEGWLERGNCLLGFPHPSGANARWARAYAERREALGGVVEGWARRGRGQLVQPRSPGGPGVHHAR